jgi:HEAT repeat protein
MPRLLIAAVIAGALAACGGNDHHASTSGNEVAVQHDTDAAVSNAMRALRAPQGGLREAMELVRLGPASAPALIEATGDVQPRVRALSCVALGALGTPSNDVVGALRRRLDDENPQVRYSAARALGELETVPADVLARLDAMRSHDPDPTVRGGADEALLALGGPAPRSDGGIDAQLRSIEVADPQARAAAIDGLGRMGQRGEIARPDDVIPAITSHLASDDYYQCRISAALALWRIGRADPVVLSALTSAMSDPHPLVQTMAAQVLGNFGSKAASTLPALRALAAATQHPAIAELARKAIARIAP